MTQRRKAMLAFLLGPGATWLLIFFLLPGALIFVYSVLTRKDGGGVLWIIDFSSYVKLFSPGEGVLFNDFVIIFLRSLWWAAITSFICLLLGYPLAYFIAMQPEHVRSTYIFLVLIPFWTNFLVRTYAWKFILNNNGLLNTVLQSLNLERVAIINTPAAVLIGLVYGSLPFMVLPLYSALEKMDWSLLEAAADLGANTFWSTVRILIPLTMPGIVAGSIIVFIPSLGAYVTPDLMGGARVALLGNLLQQQFMTVRDWPFGSAIGFIMMAIMLAATLLYFRTLNRNQQLT